MRNVLRKMLCLRQNFFVRLGQGTGALSQEELLNSWVTFLSDPTRKISLQVEFPSSLEGMGAVLF